MDRALDLPINRLRLPVYTPLTREGEVELARQFERGDRFGLSREKVRQIEVAALMKLKRAYEKETDGPPGTGA